ncbi:error-prone DNA polymerase [bacterium]|nr:error-prone DNA polymerase [bacterium]
MVGQGARSGLPLGGDGGRRDPLGLPRAHGTRVVPARGAGLTAPRPRPAASPLRPVPNPANAPDASTYAPLWVKSNYSFLEGASHPSELVERAHALGLDAVALTDRDGVYGIVQAHVTARRLGVKLLCGAQVTVGAAEAPDEAAERVVLLAQSRSGWGNLCRLLSKGRLRCEKGSSVVTAEEVAEHHADLIALAIDASLLPRLTDAFGDRLYALACRHLVFEEQPREHALRLAARRCGVPVAAANEVLYHEPERQPLQDVVTCIRHGVPLTEAGRHLRPNAENDLKSAAAMRTLFLDDPEALARTREIAERCAFSLAEIRYRYPAEDRPSGKSEKDWLHELVWDGAFERHGGHVPADVHRQIERELDLIHELDYGGYFLTMYEIVQFCRRENIYCQGRGSAANSVVCYCLGITAVDPVRLDLLFERFLSRERDEPPDIDLDIEHERREEVIQWVYRRYGRRRAAMVSNVVRYRPKSAARDVGKALGIAETALDRLSKLLGSRFANLEADALTHSGLDPESPRHRHLLRLIEDILDFPRHLSIHPGGFLLGHEPVDTLVPIEPATMEDRTVIQWDKYAVEDLGLFKVDLLGLGALTHIRRALDLLRKHEGRRLTLDTIPAEDSRTYEMISCGDTVGVFQIESRAQMSMLPRLKPRTFYDLVIEVAIVRPGPIQGQMVHPYLKRRSGEEAEHYPHPALERVLRKTLGVPIFQEQVMKIAVLVGGYTGGEADQLRRDMAAWKSAGRIENHRETLVSRMVGNGIEPEFAERIFSQIRGFGEYGFPESHAASFALLAYVTAWLRCHAPAAFTCALLNSQPMGFYTPATLVEDARRRGVAVRPIDVNESSWDCTMEADGTTWALRMGLRYVRGLATRDRESIERVPGPFRDLEQFVRASRLPLRPLMQLAEAGAFDTFGHSRRDAVWRVRELVTRLGDELALGGDTDPEAQPSFRKLSSAQQVLWDYRTSSHSTRGHPLGGVRGELAARGLPDAATVQAMRNGKRTSYAGLVICRQQPGTSTGVTFYTLEDETGFVNVVVWKPVFEKYSVLARTAPLLGITGKVQVEGQVVHLIAEKLWDPQLSLRPAAKARSFH